jgi:hypothetical protein
MRLVCEINQRADEIAATGLLVGSSSRGMDFIQLAKAVAQNNHGLNRAVDPRLGVACKWCAAAQPVLEAMAI